MVDVFVALGAAIVKAGVKVWLKDNDFAADAGASLTDLISGRISDEYDRRKARRIFEDLEEPVVKRLKSLRQTEFGGLPQNEWNAAVIAAGETFGRSQLTAAELFTRDLDPLFLERHIQKGNPQATRDLSDGGTQLYDRLISEGCSYVIEIADKLPHFQAGAFAELLRRDRQIVGLITEVLDRIPSQSQGRAEEARFVTACRRRIATKLDRLSLLGLDFDSSWHPLTLAYVSLRIQQPTTDRLIFGQWREGREPPGQADPGSVAEALLRLASDGGRPVVFDAPAGAGKTALLKFLAAAMSVVEQQLAYSPRLLLLGRAGSGKTTVLQWLAVNAARGTFTGQLTDFNEHFPFYLRLREYEGAVLPAPAQFLASIAPLLVNEAPDPRWASRQLASGRALVLVDGVDEVAEAHRNAVADWLSDLVDLYPGARYVVTARPEAVPPDWLTDSGFRASSLEPMTPSLVQTFIHNWYEAARHRLLDDEERAQLDGYEKVLRSAMTDDRYLRDLADTPLLAGLLCALNLHLRSNLPRRRTEIYERALAMFDQRDRVRGLAEDRFSLDLTAKTHVLADLALWMVRNGQSEVALDVAEAQLSRSYDALTMKSAGQGKHGLGRYLLERSGLLREPAAGSVDFVHRTFQEFLAAKAVINADSVGELVSNAGNDHWGEVIVLAAGQANQVQARRLLRGLLKGSRQDGQRHARQALAVASLQEVKSVDQDTQRDVNAVIPELLPPRSMEHAEQLAATGAPLVSLLAQHWARVPGRAAETIRAASLVGGAAAMDLIGEIIDHAEDFAAMDEVSRSWQYFDPGEFARRVLAGRPIPQLTVSGTKYLTALREVPDVRALTVRAEQDGAIDLTAIAELTQLKTLILYIEVPLDLRPLNRCGNLKSLIIWDHSLGEVQSLPGAPDGLNHLGLYGCIGFTDLMGIEDFNRLTSIVIDNCYNLTVSWQWLRMLPDLREVSIYRPHAIDLSGFRHSGRETKLKLSECGELDLTPLAGDAPVEVIHDSGTQLTNVPDNVRVIPTE